jgi:hypothetical protein
MVCHSLLVRWQKQQAAEGDPILAMLKSRRKANCAGPLGQLKPLKDALLWYVSEQHKQGITMSTLTFIMKASSLSPEFRVKHFVARTSAVKQFVRAYLLVIVWARTNCSANWMRLQGRHSITWL